MIFEILSHYVFKKLIFYIKKILIIALIEDRNKKQNIEENIKKNIEKYLDNILDELYDFSKSIEKTNLIISNESCVLYENNKFLFHVSFVNNEIVEINCKKNFSKSTKYLFHNLQIYEHKGISCFTISEYLCGFTFITKKKTLCNLNIHKNFNKLFVKKTNNFFKIKSHYYKKELYYAYKSPIYKMHTYYVNIISEFKKGKPIVNNFMIKSLFDININLHY